jgi:hypothetical protein
MENKNYDELTLEALLIEQKKLKRSQMYAAFGIGFLIAVMLYGIVKGGFGYTYILIPLVLIAGIGRSSEGVKQNLKQIQEAINNKK